MSNTTTLASALEELVHAAAEAPDSAAVTTVLATAVVDLERASGASLGPVGRESLVVLQRRLGRVHRLLLDTPGTTSPDRVRAHLRALCRPAPAPASPAPHAQLALAAACECP